MGLLLLYCLRCTLTPETIYISVRYDFTSEIREYSTLLESQGDEIRDKDIGGGGWGDFTVRLGSSGTVG